MSLAIEQGRPEGVLIVGGFPEFRAIRGAPEALRVLRGKSCCEESPIALKVLLAWKSPPARARLPAWAKIRLLYCTMVK